MTRLVAFLLLLFVACEEPPTAVPLPPPPGEGSPPAPPSEEPPTGRNFTWDGARGIVVFAGTQAAEGQILALDARLRERGWENPTYHVCAEVQSWEGTPWADGPPAFSEENLENLRRFLRTTAALGSQVLLDVVCTMKEDGTPWEEILQWTHQVGKEVAPFSHVAIHLGNEIWHPRSSLRQRPDRWRAMRNALRAETFSGPIGADDNSGSPKDTRYNSELAAIASWADFHPFRNPNPGPGTLRAYARNGPVVVLSETTGYSTDPLFRDQLCCTGSREEIRAYLRRAEAAGLIFFYHSTDGLLWPTVHFEWIPTP